MTNQSTAKEHIEAMLKDSLAMFTNHPTKKNLTEKYNSDKSLAESYHGRELLELVQNADDACLGIDKKHQNDILIEYKENSLRISNKGSAFNKDSIERLSQGNVSGKGPQYIGNKGIGFRSILNWAEEVRIYSGDYSLGFSKKFAANQLEQLKNKFQNIRDEIEAKPQITFPILWAPYCVENKLEPQYDTTIEIIIDPVTQNDDWNVQNQIKEFDFNILLFLQNITKISIKTDSEFYGLKRASTKENGFDKFQLKKIDYKKQGLILKQQAFYTFKRDDESFLHKEENAPLKISVAIPCDFNHFESNLYTFFPIKNEKSPVPALLHATFLLEQNRNTIQTDQLNTTIFERLMNYYIQVVTDNFAKKEYGNIVAKLLTPTDNTIWEKFGGTRQEYKNLCKEKLMLLNVNGKFISIDRRPRIYESFPNFFKGDDFELLCAPINNPRVSEFLKELIGEDKFTSEEIKAIIDNSSKQWNCQQRIECFKWWLDNIKSPYYIPKILKDQNGNWIVSKDKQIFFPPSENLTSIPEWHNMLILNRNDANELESFYRNKVGKNDKREVISCLNNTKIFTFREYSADSLIDPLKNAIGDNYERAAEFIRWIRQNNKTNNLEKSDKIFPCLDKSIHCAEEIYLGKEYEENIFVPFLKASGKVELCEPALLYLEGENKENNNLKPFLKHFDFAKEPQIIEDKLNRYSISKECEKNYFEYGKNQLIKASEAQGNANERILNEESIITIEKISDILVNIPTIEILKWIFGKDDNSKRIFGHLLNPEETTKVYYKPDDKKIKDRVLEIKTKNFLWYVFSFTPWITLEEKKYAPSECKFASKNPLEAECLSEVITDEYLENIYKQADIDIDSLKRLLTSLGCNSNYLNLSPKSFYALLLKLPKLNVSESVKLSHSIYCNCIQALSKDDTYIKKYQNNPDGENFKRTGMLLCKNDHSYKPVKDIFFSSSSVLNPLQKLLFDIPLKSGKTAAIIEIFKISSYDLNWERNIKPSENDISDHNATFQTQWQQYIPFVLCLLADSLRDNMIPKFRKLQLTLISKLKNEEGSQIELKDGEYHLLEGENKHYFIYIGNGDLNKYRLSLAIGDLLQKLLNTENNERMGLYSELFRSDENSRIGLIQQHEYLDILDDCKRKFLEQNFEENSLVKFLQEKGYLVNDTISKMLNHLYYGKKLSISEQKELSHFLQKNSLDIPDLKLANDQDQQNVTIIDYNKKQLEQKFEETEIKDSFEWALWINCKNADEKTRSQFRQNKESLIDIIQEANIEDSVKFDPGKAISEIFEKKFGSPKNKFDFSKKPNYKKVDDVYRTNRQKIATDGIPNAEEFLNDPKIKSLLYFDTESVQIRLNQWIVTQKKQDSSYTFPKDTNISYNTELKSSAPHFSTSKNSIKHPRRQSASSNSDTQNQGDEAEKLVVSQLRKNNIPDIKTFFGNQDFEVEWKSKAAERIEKTDGDDNLGFDILLRGKDGKLLYLDVKSHEGPDCCFMMSANEINFAKEHLTEEKDEYRIIYVSNFKLSSQQMSPSINVLPKDFLNNKDYAWEYQSVRIYLK